MQVYKTQKVKLLMLHYLPIFYHGMLQMLWMFPLDFPYLAAAPIPSYWQWLTLKLFLKNCSWQAWVNLSKDTQVVLCLPSAWGSPWLMHISFAPGQNNLVSANYASEPPLKSGWTIFETISLPSFFLYPDLLPSLPYSLFLTALPHIGIPFPSFMSKKPDLRQLVAGVSRE